MKVVFFSLSVILMLTLDSCNQQKTDNSSKKEVIESKSRNVIKTYNLEYVPLKELRFDYTIYDSLVKIHSNGEGKHYDCLKGEIENIGDSTIYVLGSTCYGIDCFLQDRKGNILEPLSILNCNYSYPWITKVTSGDKLKIVELFNKKALDGKMPLSISLYTVNQIISEQELKDNPEIMTKVNETKTQDMIVVKGRYNR